MMTLDYHSNRVTICVGRSVKHLRSETIARYLPRYMDLLVYYQSPVVYPEDQLHADGITCKALRYLFDYLEEIDQGCHTSAALSDRLNKPWDSLRHGECENGDLFMALGRILHRDRFGSNRKLQSIMTAHVMRHCAEIVRGRMDGWIDYLNALEGMGTESTELAQLLSYVVNEHGRSYVPFLVHGSDDSLSGRLRLLLVELLYDGEERDDRARRSCERCHQRGACEHGDRQMVPFPKLSDEHRSHGRRPICSDWTRRNQVLFDRNHNQPFLLWENEMDLFSDPGSVLGPRLLRRR